jgi:hypothetical protein
MALVMSASNRSGCSARPADLWRYDGVTKGITILLRVSL